MSRSYIAGIIRLVKSWLDLNGILVRQRLKIHGRNDLIRFADERPPKPDEFHPTLDGRDFLSDNHLV